MTAAALCNAILTDFGLITPTKTFEVVDAAKIRREKNRIGSKEVTSRGITNLECIGTDGKRDKDSRVLITGIDGLLHRRSTTVEHISYTIESGNIFLI